MTVLVTGADGYVGWPTALRCAANLPKERVVLVDNGARRKWVEECGAVSAVPIASMKERMACASKKYPNLTFVEGDLTDSNFVDLTLSRFKPRAIAHLAAQPSAPYAQINADRAAYTQHNNLKSTLNLIWGLRKHGLKDTHLIETTTTGVYGAPNFDIPEGFIEVERNGKRDTLPYPGLGGSWYHITKCMDFENLYLNYRQTGQPTTDLRTSIVTGIQTKETAEEPLLATRFDFDFWFGVVTHRFCAQAMSGHPLTVYGEGEQGKPLVTLEDAVESVFQAIEKGNEGEFKVCNQTLGAVSIKDIACSVSKSVEKTTGSKVEVTHIKNPRVEDEKHKMAIDNEKFRKLLGRKPEPLEKALNEIVAGLAPVKETVYNHRDCFLSKDLS